MSDDSHAQQAPVVFLHIGEPKTGTTYLQDVLWRNRAHLAEQGVLLPGRLPRDHFRSAQDLREIVRTPDDPAVPWEGEWDALARHALSAPRAAVISHELLSECNPRQAAHAVRSLEGAQVHVVLTVRDLGRLLPAEWQETVKHRATEGWEDWLQTITERQARGPDRRRYPYWKVHDTLEILRVWSELVPAERIHVITVPPPGAPRDLLWRRFAQLIGVDSGAVDTSGTAANASLGMPEVELLRRINERTGELPRWFYMRRVKAPLAQRALQERSAAGRLVLPAEQLSWARAEAQRVVTGIRGAGYDVIGELDELTPRPADGPGARAEDVTDAELLDVALTAIQAVLAFDLELTRKTPHGPAVRSAVGRVTGSYRLRRTAGRLVARHPSLQRARVLGWRLADRVRGRSATR